MKNTVNILGINFINTTVKQFVHTLGTHIENREKTFVVTANPEIVMDARKNETLMNIIQGADYVTADGIGIVKSAGLLGVPLPERVPGFDVTMRLLKLANKKGLSVYLLGGKDRVVEKAADRIKSDFPNVKIAGYHHGYFDLADDQIMKTVESTKPDIILVALGAPRQEQWISKSMPSFDHGIFIGVGGTFDVIAGEAKRAPEIWQKMNLEWFYRLVRQPSRWKRQMALPQFAFKILQQKLQKNITPADKPFM
ncbi:WecB/TagA/CpsF family glycosyltransferase [Fictibacillus enclensis]|uniref:WecB/TagA/CpsF family glycosyltransferase n=1 Tax=Fictibacillus enclensis TaxID=1017270 RepID=UPI0024BFF4DA|nr:WecB/TagA/CpsF family glycosyltransferase [Fictibacillus enclensis]WHY71628.1 WecB/TagA/CpsF family glycosyltransferase [Fictibacillus enclensis]